MSKPHSTEKALKESLTVTTNTLDREQIINSEAKMYKEGTFSHTQYTVFWTFFPVDAAVLVFPLTVCNKMGK